MLMIEHRELSWWYWLVTVCFLTAGVAGWSMGFFVAIGVTIFQMIHYIIRERGITAFPVQVRVGYLLLLLIVLPEPLQLIYWIPTIGTWAQLIFGYCAMARIVSLMPWNRKEKLSLNLVWRKFFSVPVKGSILRHQES